MVGLVGKWGFISLGRLWWKISAKIIGLILGKSGSPLKLQHTMITGILIWLVNSCGFLALPEPGMNSSQERIIQVTRRLLFVHLCSPRKILGCCESLGSSPEVASADREIPGVGVEYLQLILGWNYTENGVYLPRQCLTNTQPMDRAGWVYEFLRLESKIIS